MGDEPERAAGGRLPLTWAKRATVAQVVAIAAGVVAMASGLLMWRIVAYTTMDPETGASFFPKSITTWSELLSVAPAGAGALAAVAALTLRGRHLAFILLAAALPCIAAGGGPTYAYGPGSGILSGIVAPCSPAEEKAAGGLDTSRVVTVSVQNQAGRTVASRRLPFRTSGARYRMRLPAGTYFINAVSAQGASAGDTLYIPADKTIEADWDDPGDICVG